MLTGKYKKFCKDYDKVEGYERALHSDEPYFIHHKQGIYASVEELKEYGWYYNCPPDCVMWVTKSEHDAIHNAHRRLETRKKISEANKGHIVSEDARRKIGVATKSRTSNRKGAVLSEETRKKMSESAKAAWAKRNKGGI